MEPPQFLTLNRWWLGGFMFKLNQPVYVESAHEALKEETGVFEVVSPGGDILRASCTPGKPIAARWIKFVPELQRHDHLWSVTKIGEAPDPD